MATHRINVTTALKIKVGNGTTDTGTVKYATRSYNSINPEITDEDLYTIGQGLAAMQTHEVGDILRTETATLAAD